MKPSRDSVLLIVLGCLFAIPFIIGLAERGGYDISFIPFADKFFPDTGYVDPCETRPCYGGDDLQRDFPPGHDPDDLPESMKDLMKQYSSSEQTNEVLLGVWRNDAEKLDYHFSPDDNLEVVGANGSVHSLPCTFSSDGAMESRTLDVWFNCPQSDWPGYAELHELIFAEDYKSFVDTSYVQGMVLQRYDGRFVRLTP